MDAGHVALHANNEAKGYWQEQIIWNIVNDVYGQRMGVPKVISNVSVDIRKSATWTQGTFEIRLDWFKPNTHPRIVGSVSKPDFRISVNGKAVLAIESKNHKLNYEPWGIPIFKDHVISRFQNYGRALHKIVVIGKLLIRRSEKTQVEGIVKQQHIEFVETGRQATSTSDSASYNAIRRRLEPKLLTILPKRMRWKRRIANWILHQRTPLKGGDIMRLETIGDVKIHTTGKSLMIQILKDKSIAGGESLFIDLGGIKEVIEHKRKNTTVARLQAD